MAKRILLAVAILGVCVRAGEPAAEAATSHLPADARMVLRFAAPERLDAVGREMKALWDLTGELRLLSQIVLPAGAVPLGIDPGRPFYLSFDGEHAEWLFHARTGTAWAEATRRAGEDTAVLADGFVRVGDPAALERPRRGEPFGLVEGDVSVAVDVQALLALLPPEVAQEIEKLAHGAPPPWQPEDLARELPAEAQPFMGIIRGGYALALQLARTGIRAVRSIETFQYAATWRDGRVETEGWIRTLERSPLRAWLVKAGEPAPHRLAGYLPRNAFYVVDSCGIGSWLDREMESFLDAAWGEGAGRDTLLLLGPSFALAEHLTGKGAGAVVLAGMSGSMRSIWEIKEGAPIGEAIAKLDAASLNRRMAAAGLPLRTDVARNIDHDGDTPIHRIGLTSDIPELAFAISNMQFCFAVEGRYLLTAQSMNPKGDLRSFLFRVRGGGPGEHPHLDAMARLAPDGRHEGISLNFGAIKQTLAPFVMMAPPELGRIFFALPDELWLSTALGVEKGHIHLRGDWPVREILAMAEKLR